MKAINVLRNLLGRGSHVEPAGLYDLPTVEQSRRVRFEPDTPLSDIFPADDERQEAA